MDHPIKENAPRWTQGASVNKPSKSNNFLPHNQAKHTGSGAISPASVLGMLGVRYRHSGKTLQVFCPFHAEGKERNPSLVMDARDGHYKCFTCGAKGGDVIAFFQAKTGSSFKEALFRLGVRHV